MTTAVWYYFVFWGCFVVVVVFSHQVEAQVLFHFDALGLPVNATCFFRWFCDSLHSRLGCELVQRPQTLSVIFQSGSATVDIFITKALCAIVWLVLLFLFAVSFISGPVFFTAASLSTTACLLQHSQKEPRHYWMLVVTKIVQINGWFKSQCVSVFHALASVFVLWM